MQTLPNIKLLQFIYCGVGFTSVGKKDITKTSTRNIRDTIFSGAPCRPNENLEGRSDS
jgi:hypothetical protein